LNAGIDNAQNTKDFELDVIATNG